MSRSPWVMSSRAAPLAAVAVAMLLGGCGEAHAEHLAAPRVEVRPPRALLDQPRTIVMSGLRPFERATIVASAPGAGGLWSAGATYTADRAGVIDLAEPLPSEAAITVSQRSGCCGPSARPDTAHKRQPRAVTTLKVMSAHRPTVTAKLVQLARSARVSDHNVTLGTAGFVGQYFDADHPGQRPGVVVWGGSEGGLGVSGRWAALLASHDLPALALAYFDEPGLLCSVSGIRLEYFVTAIRWLRRQPGIDPARVWILSASRGTEAELLTAAYWPGLVHGLVAAAPSSIGYGASAGSCQPHEQAAWTLRGKPIAHAIIGRPTETAAGVYDDRAGFEATLGTATTDAATIPIGRFAGPVMLISGGDDQLWPSDTYADQIMHELRHDPSYHEHLNCPRAGHIVLGIPSVPSSTKDDIGRIALELGGSPSANDAAHRADWPAMMTFIGTH